MLNGYDIGERALDLGPRWLRQAATFALAVALMTHGGWAASLITSYAQHRPASLMDVLQHAVVPSVTPPVTGQTPVRTG